MAETERLPDPVGKDDSSSAASHAGGAQAGSPRFKRRRLVVLPRLQLKLITLHFLVAGLFGLLLLTAVLGPDIAAVLSTDADEMRRQEAADRLLALHLLLLPSLILGAAAIGGVALIVSHRIAGPLYRFQQVQLSVARGRIGPSFRLRPNDLLVEGGTALNEMLDGLRFNLGAVLERERELAHTLASIRSRSRKGYAVEASALERLDEELTALEASLEFFEIEASDREKRTDRGRAA